MSQALDRIDTSTGAIQFHDGTVTQRLSLAANATSVTLSAAPVDPSLLVVIAEQTLVSGTDFTTNGTANTVTLTASITEPMVVRVSYPVVGGGRGSRTSRSSRAAAARSSCATTSRAAAR